MDSATIVRAAAVSDFSAKSTDIDVQLQWRISDLTGLVGLGLTRSPAGQQAPVPIHGDSLLAASTIRFVDTTFEPGQAYDYQLVLHYSSGTTLGSSSLGVTAPGKFALAQNAPNPFNPSTRIRFMMPTTARAELVVFDVGGRRVRTLLAGEVEAGSAETSWDGRDQIRDASSLGNLLLPPERSWHVIDAQDHSPALVLPLSQISLTESFHLGGPIATC